MLTAVGSRVAAPTNSSPPRKSLEWKQIVTAVEPFLQSVTRRLQTQIKEFDPQIASYAEYALAAQGKQLRPALVALSGEAAGGLTDDHVMVAVIIEMIHLATLAHDDVIDEAELRQGRPSLAANWGNEISVLVGDCLFAQALRLAASFPTPEICRAVASATNIVCAGEILQTRSRGQWDIPRSHYFKMVEMKTAELFALSCDLGGCLSECPPASRTALRQYGRELGAAYQLYDDCLDLLGSEASAGKTLGADLAKGKMTLPLLVVRERASGADLEQLRGWLRQWDPACLPEALEIITRHEGFHEARVIIQQRLAEAQKALEALPPSVARGRLQGLTEFLAEQTEALGVVY